MDDYKHATAVRLGRILGQILPKVTVSQHTCAAPASSATTRDLVFHVQLLINPPAAPIDPVGVWALVQPTFATLFTLQVFDRVGDE
jgi:hypothetical protein